MSKTLDENWTVKKSPNDSKKDVVCCSVNSKLLRKAFAAHYPVSDTPMEVMVRLGKRGQFRATIPLPECLVEFRSANFTDDAADHVCYVRPREFRAITKKIDTEICFIECFSKRNECSVFAWHSKFSIETVEEFSKGGAEKAEMFRRDFSSYGTPAEVSTVRLIDSLKRAVSIPSIDSHLNLDLITLGFSGSTLTVSATDGRQMTVEDVPLAEPLALAHEPIVQEHGCRELKLKRGAINVLLKVLDRKEPFVSIENRGEEVWFSQSSFCLGAKDIYALPSRHKKIVYRFTDNLPNYSTSTVDYNAFIRCAKKVVVGAYPVSLEIQGTKVAFEQAGLIKSYSWMTATESENRIDGKIEFNGHQVLKTLSLLKEQDQIAIYALDDKNMLVFEAGNFRLFSMPYKRSADD